MPFWAPVLKFKQEEVVMTLFKTAKVVLASILTTVFLAACSTTSGAPTPISPNTDGNTQYDFPLGISIELPGGDWEENYRYLDEEITRELPRYRFYDACNLLRVDHRPTSRAITLVKMYVINKDRIEEGQNLDTFADYRVQDIAQGLTNISGLVVELASPTREESGILTTERRFSATHKASDEENRIAVLISFALVEIDDQMFIFEVGQRVDSYSDDPPAPRIEGLLKTIVRQLLYVAQK